MTESSYQYTNNWFNIKSVKGVWDTLIPQFNPTKFLEIGSYGKASACYIIEKIAAKKYRRLHCIDGWRADLNIKGTAITEMTYMMLKQDFTTTSNFS